MPATFRAASSASTTGTTLTVAKPTGTQAGDWLYFISVRKAPSTITPPAGWSLREDGLANILTDAGATQAFVRVYQKLATAEEPANYEFKSNESEIAGGIVAVAGASGIDAIAVASSGTSNVLSMNAPSVTAASDGSLLLVAMGTANGATFSMPGGTTEIFDVQTVASAAGKAMAVGREAVNKGATGTRTITNQDPGGFGAENSAALSLVIGPSQTHHEAEASGVGTGTGAADATIEAGSETHEAQAAGIGTGTGSASAVATRFATATGTGTGTGSATASIEGDEPTNRIIEDPFDGEAFKFWWFAGPDASLVGGRARLACTKEYDGLLVSDVFTRLRGSTWTVEAPVLAQTNKAGTETFFHVEIDEDNELRIQVLESGKIKFREEVGGSGSITELTYNAEAHRWWRISVDAEGTILWQTSPDGEEWTTRREKASAIDLEMPARVRLRTGNFNGEVLEPAYTEFDNLTVDVEWEDFQADAEEGDFSDFGNVQAPAGRATVVESPVAEGQRAYRLELQPGDIEPETGDHRAELISGRKYVEGQERYFRILFRVDAWDHDVWGLIWQLRISGGTNPPVALLLHEGKLRVAHGNGETLYWQGPEVEVGRWYEVVVRVLPHPSEGEVGVWLGGKAQEMLKGTGLATMGASYSYDKVGVYRDPESDEPAVVYHDDYRVTETFFSEPPQHGAPEAITGKASSITPPKAMLNGTVDPNGIATTYYFEWGETKAYGTKVPAGEDGDAGENFGAVAVSEAITGLKPNATYHFRLVAVNAEGESVGEDATFTTSKAPRIAVNREYPPARHTVIVRDPKTGAPIARWAEDENRPHNVYEGLTLSGALPGGDKQMSLNLGRDPRADYPDMQGMLDVECQLPGRDVIWEGRHGKDQRSDGERSEIGLEAVGHGAAMEDRKGIKAGIIDCELGKWGEPSTQRRLNLLAAAIQLVASTSVGGHSVAPESTISQLINDFTNVTRTEESEAGEFHYDAGGVDIGQVRYDHRELTSVGAQSLWESNVALGTTDTFATATVGADHDASQALNQVVTAPGAGYRFARIRNRWTPVPDGSLGAVLTRVFGWHPRVLSLLSTEQIGPPQGTWPDIGYTAAQMLAALIPEFSYLEVGQLDDDGFIVPQAWWGEGQTTLAQIVAEITRYGLYDYRVRGKRFELREPGTYGERWIAPRDTTQLEEAGEDSERSWDRIVGIFQDPSGRTASVGYPGSGADQEFAELQITDPDHPAVKTGRPREEALELQVITTHTRAKEVCERWLKEANELSRAGKATLEGYVQSERGVWHPVAKVREGDLLRIPGARDRGYRKVVDYSYDAVRRQKPLSLDAPSEDLAALLERFRAVLVPMGIG